jgi:formamidopyrimidine-DNA glycosylase
MKEELDITSPTWDMGRVMGLLPTVSGKLFCDILLDQDIFLGVGNIIKNEALFLSNTHPLSVPREISIEQAERIVRKVREFSLKFYDVKKRDEMIRPYARIYQRRKCPLCEGKITREKTGERDRISYFCATCQILYA